MEGARIDGVIEREAVKKNTTPDIIREAYKSGTSLKTFVKAEDIASMALFLASDQAVRISGQVIAVDGHTENPDPKIYI